MYLNLYKRYTSGNSVEYMDDNNRMNLDYNILT